MDIGAPDTEHEIEIAPLEEPVPVPAPAEEPIQEYEAPIQRTFPVWMSIAFTDCRGFSFSVSLLEPVG